MTERDAGQTETESNWYFHVNPGSLAAALMHSVTARLDSLPDDSHGTPLPPRHPWRMTWKNVRWQLFIGGGQ